MKNYIRPGETMTHAHLTAVDSGQLVAIGTQLAVAAGAYAAGEVGIYRIEGVFELPKAVGETIGQGSTVNLNLGSGELVSSLPAVAIVGGAVAMEDASSDAATVVVKLTPGVGVSGGSGS